MSTARRRPVVVEVRPDDANNATVAPPSPPKAVRFPEQAEIVTGVTRPLTPTEAWSLYYFETHSRSCKACFQPYQTVLNGGRLCPAGQDLAYDVAMHVYHREGQVYSTTRERSRDIRVEIPFGYDRLLALLKATDRKSRQKRSAPRINYETKSTRAPAVQPILEEEEPWSPTYVQPAQSRCERRSRHKPIRYSTIVVGDNDYDRTQPTSDGKRGSLYKGDNQLRPRKEYRIEVIQPSSEAGRRHRRKDYYD